MLIYEITNKDKIPEDLKPGKYTTKVMGTELKYGDVVVQLEYVGKEYNSDNPQCLFPLTKHAA